MSRRKSNAIKCDGGKICPKCHQNMQRYEHPPGWVPRPRHFWFRYWDRCDPCGHMQLYSEARVEASRAP